MDDLFVHMLSDIHSAEKQLTRALAKFARAATEPSLSDAFKAHLEETQGQVERIDQVVETCGLRLKRMKCVAMEGLIEEGQELIDEIEKGPVLDVGLVAAAQKVLRQGGHLVPALPPSPRLPCRTPARAWVRQARAVPIARASRHRDPPRASTRQGPATAPAASRNAHRIRLPWR
ncbi:ferritin-like domain-containing protein [Burkholderia plantarii]|uniref:YciE/YciF ferroxidase family protein n=1 Tax=Burkholderia plantarii TaxID=41899 RepID=UPI003F49C76F